MIRTLLPISLREAERMEVAASFKEGRPVGVFSQGSVVLTCPQCSAAMVRGLGDNPNRMFAGIALRCSCDAWSRIPEGTQWSTTADTPEGRPAGPYYRYFEREEYRDAFLRGEVWTTTLHACKDHPDERRVDGGEGTLHYSHDPLRGLASDPYVRAVAARVGVSLPNAPVVVELAGNEVDSSAPDAWMLCVSRVYSSILLQKFGLYCVRIDRPASLFNLISSAISAATPLDVGGYRRVYYRGRSLRNLDQRPGSEVFVKPIEYALEAETRFVWLPQPSVSIVPTSFSVEVQAGTLHAMPMIHPDDVNVPESLEQLSSGESSLWRAAAKRHRRGLRRLRNG